MASGETSETRFKTPQASHHLRMSPEMFRALALAIYTLSVRELETCSPRRLLTEVLNDPGKPIFKLSVRRLDATCRLDKIMGAVKLSVRIDSAANDRLREFREYAEGKLGRPVSVMEAVNVCIHSFNGS